MEQTLSDFLIKHRNSVYSLFRYYIQQNKTFLLHSDIWYEFKQFLKTESGAVLKDSPIEKLIFNTQVAVLESPWVYLFIRAGIANSNYYKFHLDNVQFQTI